jgi:hypothetical protein
MTRAEVQAFFERYAAAFERGDASAVAPLWHTPSVITDVRDGRACVTCWTEREPMHANMVALCAAYAEAGEHAWRFELTQHVPMGPHHAFTLVRWTMQRLSGEVLQRFSTGYQLARFADGPRVLLCTAYDENLHDFNAAHAAS